MIIASVLGPRRDGISLCISSDGLIYNRVFPGISSLHVILGNSDMQIAFSQVLYL